VTYYSPEALRRLGERVLDQALTGPSLKDYCTHLYVKVESVDYIRDQWSGIPELFTAFSGPDPASSRESAEPPCGGFHASAKVEQRLVE
jgi:hypothetical protein